MAKRPWTSRRLRKARLAFLWDNPYCSLCAVRGEVELAVQIHHIFEQARWPTLIEEIDNWLAVCLKCHGVLTFGGRREKCVGPGGRLR